MISLMTKTWIFQSNPKRFDIENALIEAKNNGLDLGFATRNYTKEYEPGQTVYFWRSQSSGKYKSIPGIIGKGKIKTYPKEMDFPPWAKNYIRGDTVKKNDLLIEISIEDRNELLNSFNKEYARIEKEIILNREKKDNNTLKTNKQINLFQIEYNSAKELLDKGLGSESMLSLASLNLTQAKTNLKEIDINYQSQSINLESQLENIKSKIKNINLDIENTKILAPFDGIIESSYIEEGTFVRPGDMIIKIVDLNPIKIQGYISELDINKIKLGKTANIEISNSLKKNGIITFISPVAETSTRTFEFIIEGVFSI